MGDTNNSRKPWGFGIFGGKKGNSSLLLFVLILIASILVQIGGAVRNELADRRERPALALKTFLRDLREYIRTEKQMPTNIRQLEIKIWNQGNDKIPSRLQHGNNIYVADNYEYIYFSGRVGGVSVANVWAIPLGKYRDEYETVLLVVAADGEAVWRGPALNEQQRVSVLATGFNPSLQQMSFLNMSKDAQPQAPQQNKGFSGFN